MAILSSLTMSPLSAPEEGCHPRRSSTSRA